MRQRATVKLDKIQGKISKIHFDGRAKGGNFISLSLIEKKEDGSTQKHFVKMNATSEMSNLIFNGSNIVLEGDFIEDPKFGRQFEAQKASELPIDQSKVFEERKVNALIKLLKSGLFPGVGPTVAEQVANAGALLNKDNPFEIISNESALNSAVFSKKSVHAITSSHALNPEKTYNIYGILSFSDNIRFKQANLVDEILGDKAIHIMMNHPYRLTMLPEFSFEMADQIAREQGTERGTKEHILAAAYHVLTEAEGSKGHTYLTESEMIKQVKTLTSLHGLSRSAFLGFLEESNLMIHFDKKVMLKSTYEAEQEIAEKLIKIMTTKHPDHLQLNLNHEANNVRMGFTHQVGIELSDEQKDGAATAISNKASVVTGGPGVGKTTVSKTIVQGLINAGISETQIHCAAPTGKAAQRMEESIGLKASTIHSLLGMNPSETFEDGSHFEFNKFNQLEGDVFIIDESSMIDVKLKAQLIGAIPDHAILLMAGDVDQIESINAGNVLGDIIDSEIVPTTRLTKFFRQLNEQGDDVTSGIIIKCHQMREGDVDAYFKDIDDYHDFHFVNIDSSVAKQISLEKGIELSASELIASKTVQQYKELTERGVNPVSDIQVLSPMRKGKAGVFNLNRMIRDAVNPNCHKENADHIPTSEYTFYEGDKIMQTKNDKHENLSNGEIGVILSISRGDVLCDFDGKIKEIPRTKFADQIEPAWVITNHKSQGSEYKYNIVTLSPEHKHMATRSIVYTGKSRGKKELFIFGDKEVLKSSILNEFGTTRHTRLKKFIQDKALEFNKEASEEDLLEIPDRVAAPPLRTNASINIVGMFR